MGRPSASIPRSCVSAQSEWSSPTALSIRRSGQRFGRSARNSGFARNRCGAGCARPNENAGQRPGLTTDERARLKQLERENFELKRANEILRKASAFFAQAELDRRAK
jgi:transposase